jgi:hypothetical protein
LYEKLLISSSEGEGEYGDEPGRVPGMQQELGSVVALILPNAAILSYE